MAGIRTDLRTGGGDGDHRKIYRQIMLTLRASPLVLSSRGAQGGYYLSRSPGEISLLEAVQALEGEILEFEAPSGSQAQEVLDRALQIIQNLLQTSL
jgi:DNA-binding IscR family transcriptional regulator